LGLDPAADEQPLDEGSDSEQIRSEWGDIRAEGSLPSANGTAAAPAPAAIEAPPTPATTNGSRPTFKVSFNHDQLQEAIEIVRQLDPPGVACRDLRECLHYQLRYHQAQLGKNGNGPAQVLQDAIAIVDQHLRALQNKQHKEIARAINRPIEAIPAALDYIRT